MHQRCGKVIAAVVLLGSMLTSGASADAGLPPPAPSPSIVDSQTLVAPDAGATNLGNSTSHPSVTRSMSMDESRLVVPADLGGGRVAYVFDRAPAGTWSHSATIGAPVGATPSWGNHVAVAGTTIAISDPAFLNGDESDENFGRVHVYEFDGTWAEAQILVLAGRFRAFGQGIWLGIDGLVVQEGIVCDGFCSAGAWHRFGRVGGAGFALDESVFGANELHVGIDQHTIAVGRPGFEDIATCDPFAVNSLSVIDTAPDPDAVLLDETQPLGPAFCSGVDDWYRNVDVNGDVLAFEACCRDRHELHIRRFDGAAYQEEQIVPIAERSDGLAAVPGALLSADVSTGVFHTRLDEHPAWPAGADVPLPADTDDRTPVVAAADRVALVGHEAVHVLTIAVPKTCNGEPVTVDLSLGQGPTTERDVIAGTPGPDFIEALAGDDVVCGFGGTDVVRGGPGIDMVFGGDDGDILLGDDDLDILFGEHGNDYLGGQAGGDVLIGGPGDDHQTGGLGDDWLVGLDGADRLFGNEGADVLVGGAHDDDLHGGPGPDHCFGGDDADTATQCEVVTGVP